MATGQLQKRDRQDHAGERVFSIAYQEGGELARNFSTMAAIKKTRPPGES